MNANVEFLNYIYQNSQMGVDTLNQLLEITEDEKFQQCLEKQLEGYRKFHNEAKEILNKNGYDEKGLGTFEKIRTYLMVNLQTMADDSVSHIAKMLIQGSSMGITEAVKKLHQYENDVEKDIKRLMEGLQKFEEENVEKLKEFQLKLWENPGQNEKLGQGFFLFPSDFQMWYSKKRRDAFWRRSRFKYKGGLLCTVQNVEISLQMGRRFARSVAFPWKRKKSRWKLFAMRQPSISHPGRNISRPSMNIISHPRPRRKTGRRRQPLFWELSA